MAHEHVRERRVAQLVGGDARAGIVPVERGQACQSLAEFRILGEVELRQPHLARFAIEQAQRQRAELVGCEVQVEEGLLRADDPVHFVAGRHQAQPARAAALRGGILAVGAVAAALV